MKPRYIAHTTGKQPVDDGVIVDIVIRANLPGAFHPMEASFWDWSITGVPGDIIAYRVIEQEG
jgi:hypothetical protein